MSRIDKDIDEHVRKLFLGNLNRLLTFLSYSPAKSSQETIKLNALIEELQKALSDKNGNDIFSQKKPRDRNNI